jgi:hypothetical protein
LGPIAIVGRPPITADPGERLVANALVRGMPAGRRKGSSGTVVGHACLWAKAIVRCGADRS